MDVDDELFSSDESGFTEQDIRDHVDILFRTSDVEESGLVQVSSIIEYLRIHTSFGENEEDLSILVRLADPGGNNPRLTLEQYRQIMWQWIRQLQNGSRESSDGGSEYEDFLSDSSNRVSSQSSSVKDTAGSSDLGSYSRQDEKFGVHQMSAPPEEVQQYLDKIHELQFQNSKLTEENATLQQQIYSQEENLTQSNASNDSLVRKVKYLQEAIQLRQQQDSENEELILRLQDQKQELHYKIDGLTGDLDRLKTGNKEQEANIIEYEHKIEQMTEVKRAQEIQLSERFEELKNQQNQLLYLSNTVQELKMENTDLQSKLTQSKEAFISLKQTAEDREKEDTLTRFPCSTPIKKNSSICMELKGMLESDYMPSPLCEKEIDEMDHIFPAFSSDGEDLEGSDPNISIYSVSLKDDLTMDVSKFMEKYQNKQETLLVEIREFLGARGGSGDGSFTSEFVRKVEDQMSKLSQRVTTLAQAKTDVDKRLSSQKKKVKKLKEENAVLKDAADDVMENGLSWDSVTDKRLLILMEQIDQERAHIKSLERKLRGKERTAVIVDKNKKSGAEKVLKLEICKLQSLNKDLTEKNKKLQGKVNGLVDEVEKAHRDIENQQTKVKDLEAEKAVLEVERQRAENQLTEKIQECNMRSHQSLSFLHSRKGECRDPRKSSDMSGVLPFDLVATQTQAVREENQSKLPSVQNITRTDGKNMKQPLEHLLLDEGRDNEEDLDDGGGQVEGYLCDRYSGGGQRRHSYQAAIDNHNCPPGEQHYPRCRSGSFQAAIEGGQREDREGEVTENSTQILPPSMTKESGECYQSYVSSYDYVEGCSKSHGTSSYSQNSTPLCYSVCDSVQGPGTVGCGGDFTVNSSYLTCTDTSHNHCDVMIKHLCGSGGDNTDKQTGNKNREVCGQDPDFPDGQMGDESREFGTQWRGNADDSADTLEDTSLKQRSGDLNDTPEEPDVIQVTRSGRNNTVDNKTLAVPSAVSINPSISASTTLNSSDDGAVIEHIKTASPPTITDVNSQNRSTAVMSKVKEEEMEVLGSKVKKDELNEVKVGKSKGQDKGKDKTEEEEGDKDEDSITGTSNLIRQLEKLNLSDSSGSSDLPGGGFKSSPYLKKIRQGNLAKRREQMKFLRMPDLNEMQESGQMMTNGDGGTESQVMPSIPETLLQDLGVDQEKTEQEESPDQLSEQEIENKFTSLSLAFKTDKITLEKRLEIQERSRDIAEENVAKEIKGLREALEQLNQICVDTQVRDLLLKIQKHVTVLEQASARVSSRAEVFGAVQQEKRMSKAIEIMLTHVDNLRLSHERQTSELEEARKLIQDNRPFGGSSEIGDFTGLSRRSASVCPSTPFLPKGARRRVSEATLNRSGLPHSVSMDSFSEAMHVTPSLRRELSVTEEDARSKFQQLASVAALKNSTTSAFRRASMCKQTSTSSLLGQNLRLSQDSTQSDSKSSGSGSKQHSVEEEAFQKGFEQGYKAQITGQLKQLRDQQNSITNSLEELRDKCEEGEEEVTQEVSLRDTVITKFWEHVPEWETASKKLRLATVIFFLFLAAVSVIMSFFPVGYAAVQVYPEYHHVNPPPV